VHAVNDIDSVLLNEVGACRRLDEDGNWIWIRDAVDDRIVQNYQTTAGDIIDDPADVGGYPTLAAGTPYPDADSDGMSDTWETAKFGDLSRDGTGDADTDGYTDVEEFLNGTDPGGGGPQPPVAEFSGNPTSGPVPLTVNFTDMSTNAPTSWSWTFGDSGTSSAQDPSHDYTTADSYTVSLQACNAQGCDTETKTDYITATSGGNPPVAEFVGNPTSGPVPLTVNFTDQSTNSPTSWSWDFGDTGSDTVQDPSHEYTSANTYTVSLSAYNSYGQGTETKVDYITATGGGGGDYLAGSYVILIGTYASGALSDTYSSNDVYLTIASVKSGNRHHTDVEFTFDTGLGGLSSLSYAVESNTTASADRTVYAYNYTTSNWDEVGNDSVTGTDSTIQGSISNPSNYISGGTVKLRVDCLRVKVFSSNFDLVKITAAP
jgi:PKD repeat protein